MTIFSSTGAGYVAGGKQVFPVNYETEVSQRLVDAAHTNDLKAVIDCLNDPFVDVNFIGTVCLRARKTEILLHDESANEVRVEFEEFKTEVTALFLAAHAGNATLVRNLLSVGANVNQKLFRGYATTAAVREGHIEILEILLDGGASQPACEEALLEASYLGQARLSEILMGFEMIRPHVAVHALVNASSRGFVDVVDTLIKCGVDTNSTTRVLLRSSKPSLHANVDCNALVAAIVSRQISVVRLLLLSNVKIDTKVRLGAWSWDMSTGEEFRVGAGLAEPYSITWCAVEYYEQSGSILNMLLQHLSPNFHHLGRTILHHAILCANERAVELLLKCNADAEFPVETTKKTEFRAIHLASRLGLDKILQHLINFHCDLNSRSEAGETALMICARSKNVECLKLLAAAGVDFGLVNASGQSAQSIAGSVRWALGFQQAVLDVIILAKKVPQSSNTKVFSSVIFATRANNIEALKILVYQPGVDLDEQDENGFTALMIAVTGGHVEAFQLLVYAGADLKLQNKYSETAVSLSEASLNSDAFEKAMIEDALAKGNVPSGGFYSLHRAARRGDLDTVRAFTSGKYDVNVFDKDGNTPLMLAAMEGHASICQLLISYGAKCDTKNTNYETALDLARKNGFGNEAERVLLDEVARRLVLSGARVKKHCKAGKGAPHKKLLKMVESSGFLRWGKSSKRNVICRGAEVGPSGTFRWNRRRKFDDVEPGIFRVITTRNKEIHFVCEGGVEMAELWVRGIKLVTREAIFGKKPGDA